VTKYIILNTISIPKHMDMSTQSITCPLVHTQQIHSKYIANTQQIHRKYTENTQQIHSKYTANTTTHLQQERAGQHALLQTSVKEVVVVVQHLINGGHLWVGIGVRVAIIVHVSHLWVGTRCSAVVV